MNSFHDIDDQSKILSETSVNNNNDSSLPGNKFISIPGFENRLLTFTEFSIIQEQYKEHSNNYSKEKGATLNFAQALNLKIKNSNLYNFMGDFHCKININEYVDLMEMTQFDLEKFGTKEDMMDYIKSNNITDSVENVIKKAAIMKRNLNLEWLSNKTENLRLLNSKITKLDKSLALFHGVQILNLSLNYLKNFVGCVLPRQLKILELNGNFLSNVKKISQYIPKTLLYLGLSRNSFLSDTHNLNALSSTNVTVLDLSDNDIMDLKNVLVSLSEVLRLRSLSLYGNPCSFCRAYKEAVLDYLPFLSFLDGVEIEPNDRIINDNINETEDADDFTSGTFIFSCFRVISLPAPQIEDKSKTMLYFLEISLPLLDNTLKEFVMYNNVCFKDLPQNGFQASDKKVSKRFSELSERNEEADEDAVNDTHKSFEMYYDKVSLKSNSISVSVELENIYKNLPVSTDKQAWNKIVLFTIPSIEIPCHDLRLLRDTFRSNVTVTLLSIIIANDSELKAGSKKKERSSRKDNQSIILKDTSISANNSFLTKEVIASFQCELRSPSWKDQYLNYKWSESLGSQNAEFVPEGNLKDLRYADEKSKSKATSGKGKKPVYEAEEDIINLLEIPESLTCHIGFGISKKYNI